MPFGSFRMKVKIVALAVLIPALSACQLISPIFVNYNGVRMDVANWINHQTLLSMQQKRSLAQLSKAQQKLVRIENIQESQKFDIAKENSIAFHCAQQHLSASKIQQLQQHIFDANDLQRILTTYDQQFPKIKLDASQIECE